jgi:hypothetical protein
MEFPVNLGESASLLGVSTKTLNTWIERSGIVPARNPLRKSEKQLTYDQVHELARQLAPEKVAALERVRPPKPDNHENPRTAHASATFASQVASCLRRITPSKSLRYATMHPNMLTPIIQTMNECVEKQHVLILTSRTGSPMQDAAQCLADRLAQAAQRPGMADIAGARKAAFALDLQRLLVLLAGEAEVSATDVLASLHQEVQRQQAADEVIVIVEHVDMLEIDGPTNSFEDQLWGAFTAPWPLLVCGLYETHLRSRPSPNFKKRSPRTIYLEIPKSSKRQTYDLLKTHHYPEWARQGYSFAADAFDTIIDLECGAHVNDVRTTLPYLAVRLAKHAITTDREGNFKELALQAREDLNDLLHQMERVDSALRDKFAPALHSAQADINDLIDDPEPAVTPGAGRPTKLLLRRHLVAQLICRNESYFAWPKSIASCS